MQADSIDCLEKIVGLPRSDRSLACMHEAFRILIGSRFAICHAVEDGRSKC